MKKIAIFSILMLLVFAFFICCNKKTPASPQPEQATATPIGTFTITPTITITSTITPTATMTATMICGVKFGSSSSATNGSSGPGNLFAHKFTAGAETELTSFNINLAAAGKYCIGIYNDNSGMPGNMLVWTGVQTAASGWNSANLPGPYTIASGTVFWIVFGSDVWILGSTDAAYTNYYRYEAGVTNISAIETAGTMPSVSTWLTNDTYRNHVYANGCSY